MLVRLMYVFFFFSGKNDYKNLANITIAIILFIKFELQARGGCAPSYSNICMCTYICHLYNLFLKNLC